MARLQSLNLFCSKRSFLFGYVCTQVIQPLIHERDLYLTWSLKRSKAVNGIKHVVGVVGQGHLRGIVYHLTHEPPAGLRFRDLVGNAAEDRQKWTFGQQLAFDTVLGMLLWYAWTHLALTK
jgi:pheromone shutdown protein TraB